MVQDTSDYGSSVQTGRHLSAASSEPSHLLQVQVHSPEVPGAFNEDPAPGRDEALDYVADMAESLAAMLAAMSHDPDSREIAALLKTVGDRARREVSAT